MRRPSLPRLAREGSTAWCLRLPAALPRFDSPPDLGIARCSDGATASACRNPRPRGQRCLVDALDENREIEVDYQQSQFDVVALSSRPLRAAGGRRRPLDGRAPSADRSESS
jgi:hypothetical protein